MRAPPALDLARLIAAIGFEEVFARALSQDHDLSAIVMFHDRLFFHRKHPLLHLDQQRKENNNGEILADPDKALRKTDTPTVAVGQTRP